MKTNPARFQEVLLKSKLNKLDRKGAMLPLIAVTIVILFVACVIAIDIARIHVTRSELRTATDAASRAAIEALSRSSDRQSAIDAAMNVAQLNIVAGNGLDLDPANIFFGSTAKNPDGSFDFVEGGSLVNAVRVIGSRSATSPDGAVNTFFGKLFGVESFEPIQASTATRLDRDIALVLDKSGSMGANGRFTALQNGVDVFLQEFDNSVPDERVSLTVYDSVPRKLVDMTDNLNAIRDAIALESPAGFTGIGRALEVGIDSILNDPNVRGEFSLQSIILMTDGNQNRGIGPEIVARRARDLGITVHTITFSEGANEALMQQVADTTGGTHLHAETNEDLVDAFRTIAQTLQILNTE
jgi:Mg-chelatase subunit ChlD